MYEALKSELICFLVKQVEYFYALPGQVVIGEEAAVPTLGLLKRYAPDYVAEPGTLGRKIESVLTWKPGQPLPFIFGLAGHAQPAGPGARPGRGDVGPLRPAHRRHPPARLRRLR